MFRNAEKQFVAETDEIEPGTEWERIAKLCDFNPKSNKGSKDVSRMRSIILQLKQTPLPTKNWAKSFLYFFASFSPVDIEFINSASFVSM